MRYSSDHIGAQHIALQVRGWEIAGWEQEQGIPSPVCQAPGLLLHEIAGEPNLLCLQADFAHGPPAPRHRGPRVAVPLSPSSRLAAGGPRGTRRLGPKLSRVQEPLPPGERQTHPRGYSTSGGVGSIRRYSFPRTFQRHFPQIHL